MLYKLLVLFHCFPVFKSIALLSSCLLVAFVSFMKVKVLRDLQNKHLSKPLFYVPIYNIGYPYFIFM